MTQTDIANGTDSAAAAASTPFWKTNSARILLALALGLLLGIVSAGASWSEGAITAANFVGNLWLNALKMTIIPLIVVLVLNFYFSMIFQWDESLLEPFRAMNVPLLAKGVHNVVAIWALVLGLLAAIIIAAATGRKFMSKNTSVKAALNAGALGSLLAIMNTASEVGYGNVISSLPGFLEVADALLGIGQGMPLFNVALMVNILAGITGSASGGLSIALDIFGQHFLAETAAVGIPAEVVHRIAAMASGGMDSLPHNGAVITTLAICGLTHREAYKDMFAITLLKVVVAFFGVFFYMLTGIV